MRVELLSGEKTIPFRPRPSGGAGSRLSAGIGSDPARFGLWAFLGTLTMMFVGFSSAIMVRSTAADWRPFSPPRILWWNTEALLASSAALEVARRSQRANRRPAVIRWMALTGLLGALFVAGQLFGWRLLAEQGIFLASNPHSSFFFLLTGLHGVHLLGGLVWFVVVMIRLRRLAQKPGPDPLRLFATYWHFLGALWVYLLLLLFAR